MPRSHVVARSAQRAPRPRAASRGGRLARLLVALGVECLCFTACAYSDYPIEATFCDEWCRVLRRTGCEQEPENCIRDCEGSLPSERCRPRQATLLECYESTPADRFECVGQGFQSTVRPLPQICTEQRHALIRCEAPSVMACIDACAALDATPLADRDAGDAGEQSPGDAAAEALAAGAEVAAPCPEPPFPCERLCWELDARGAGAGASLGAGAEDAGLSLGEPIIRCAQARAAECRAGAAAGASMLAVSWTELFLQCAGLSATLEALD